jgi:membrane associated rhomboid family serine protease
MLRRLRSKKAVSELWIAARAAPLSGARSCPSCARSMHVVGIGEGTGHIELDVCITCHFVFFDPGEFEATPDEPEPPPVKELPLEARRLLAMAKAEAIKKTAEEQMGPDAHSPLAWIPMVFGLPVELGTHKTSNVPVLTWMLVLVTAVASIATFGMAEAAQTYGLVPAEVARLGGATLITSFFLHTGWTHLGANLYFWLAFGDNLEAVLGWGRYTAILVLSTVVGGLVHVALNVDSTVPVIGASAGVSGLLVAYTVRFPRAQIGMLIFFRPFRAPMWGFLFTWIALQVLGLSLADWSVTSGGGVAFGAHLGGAAVGGLLGWRWRSVD